MTTTTIHELAGEAYGWFTTTERGEETITVLKDGTPQWVTDLVYAAHGDDFLPDDWRYKTIRSAVGAIHDDGDNVDLDDYASEWADSEVDAYTGARLQWLSSNLNRVGYVEDAVEEFGLPTEFDLIRTIGMGQYAEALEVFNLVRTALEERAEEIELEEETI